MQHPRNGAHYRGLKRSPAKLCLLSLIIIIIFVLFNALPIANCKKRINKQKPLNHSTPKSSPVSATLVAPKTLRPNSNYTVLVSLVGSEQPAKIDLHLLSGLDGEDRETRESKSLLVHSNETHSVEFSIGDWPSNEYSLRVEAQTLDSSWTYREEKKLTYQVITFSTLIQIDKAIYKPGQLVQWRAVFLDKNLLPRSITDNSINVTVADPRQNIVKQWLGLSNYRGLLSLDLQLSDDPMLGDWTIRVQVAGEQHKEASKRFAVIKYIQQSFGVAIHLPSYVTYNESSFVAQVKATHALGGYVKGMATLLVHVKDKEQQCNGQQALYKFRLERGAADMTVDLVKDLRLKESFMVIDGGREIEFSALVKEDLTGREHNKTAILRIYPREVKVELLNADWSLVSGMSKHLLLKVAHQNDTPVGDVGQTIELRFHSAEVEKVELRQVVGGIVDYKWDVPSDIQSPWRLDVIYQSIEYHLGEFSAQVNQSKILQIHVPQLNLHYNNQTGEYSETKFEINDTIEIQIQTVEQVQLGFSCQGLANGEIVWQASPQVANNQSQHQLNITVDERMSPELKVLCFYLRHEDKQIISDSISILINEVINQGGSTIKISTDQENPKPGQEIEIVIEAKANASVALLAIDQSLLSINSGNDITQSDILEVAKLFYSKSEAQQDVFAASDMIIMNNQMENHTSVFSSHEPTIITSNQVLEVRDSISDTWIWENVTIDGSGRCTIKKIVPETITSWVLSVFSLDETSAFEMTTSAAIKITPRPMCIRLELPDSIVHGEIINIQAVIVNYEKRATLVKVTLDNKKGELEFVVAADKVDDEQRRPGNGSESKIIQIAGQDEVAVSFLIVARQSGTIDIKMVASCEFATVEVARSLLVKVEGQVHYLQKAMLLDLAHQAELLEYSSSKTSNVSINIQTVSVPDSQMVHVSAGGDIMSVCLLKLTEMVRGWSGGCGAQNLAHLVTNVAILDYLQIHLNETLRIQALKNAEIGYQMQLNYKQVDGSFSLFGQSDQSGSIWLTAQVLKTFQQVKEYITVDGRIILEAANCIARHSRSDGSVKEIGTTIDLVSRESIALTAHSMVALLHLSSIGELQAQETHQGKLATNATWQLGKQHHQERIEKETSLCTRISTLEEIREKGLNYLASRLEEAGKQDDPHDLAMITYALHLSNRTYTSDRAYELLLLKAQQSGDTTWWQKGTHSRRRRRRKRGAAQEQQVALDRAQPDSLSIEMTALALLTMVKRGELKRALPIANWLVGKQNLRGGFYSARDTVFAIEALAAFATATSTKGQSRLDIVTDQSGQDPLSSEQLQIEPSVSQRVQLPDTASWVQLNANGSGMAVVQVAWQYNSLSSIDKSAFNLTYSINKASTSHYMQLDVCTLSKIADGEPAASGIAVMEVELPSGYTADLEAISHLIRPRKEVKRVDTSDGNTKVVIHLDKVGANQTCLMISAHRSSKVSSSKPKPINIYDYHDPQKAARIFYVLPQASSCDICDTSDCASSNSPNSNGSCRSWPQIALPASSSLALNSRIPSNLNTGASTKTEPESGDKSEPTSENDN